MEEVKEGIIASETWEEYRARPEVNGSLLIHGLKSMRQLKYSLDNPKDPTDCMRFGSAAHSLLQYTPAEFEQNYDIMPDYKSHPDNMVGDGTRSYHATNWSRKQEKEFAANSTKEILKEPIYEKAKATIEALHSHELCRDVIDNSIKEVTIVGTVNGYPVKGRLDLFSVAGGKFCGPNFSDMKTTQSVIPRRFAYISEAFDYLFKMRLYQRICESMGMGLLDVFLLVVEVEGARDRVRMPVPQEAMNNEDGNINRVLMQYHDSLATNKWPGMFEDTDAPMHINPWKMEDDNEMVPFTE